MIVNKVPGRSIMCIPDFRDPVQTLHYVDPVNGSLRLESTPSNCIFYATCAQRQLVSWQQSRFVRVSMEVTFRDLCAPRELSS